MVKLTKKGFTMIELLVVLVIIAILAAVATPLYLANTKRAKASEAVAAMGLIRQALRDYRVNNNTYFDVTQELTDGNIQKPLPPSTQVNTANGTLLTADTYGLDVSAGTAQYFSNQAYFVRAGGTSAVSPANGDSGMFLNPVAQDFIISVDGKDTIPCTGTLISCAIKGKDVGGTGGVAAQAYMLEMDNTGRIFITYDNGTNWSSY